MRTLVTVAALTLLLTGCFDNPKRTALRDNFVLLQAELDGGISQVGLQNRLTALDAATRAAVLDRVIDDQLAQEIAATLGLGRTVEKAWRDNFLCMKDEYVGRYCFQQVLEALIGMGMPETVAADWRQREAADIAEDKVRLEKAILEIKGNIKTYGYTREMVDERIQWAQKHELGYSPMTFTEAHGVALGLLNDRIGKTVAAFK